MKYKVKNIKYDMTDSAGKLSAEEGISLPKSLIVFCDSEDIRIALARVILKKFNVE